MGNGIVRLLKADTMNVPLSCRAGIGLIVLTFLLIGFGFVHLFTPLCMKVLWFVWILASIGGFFQVRKEPFFTESFLHGDPTWNPLFLRIGLGVMLVICLAGAMTPETRHDPYDYHLTIPALYLANDGIVEIPWHVFTYMPKNNEILYGLALGVENDSLAKIIHFMFGCLCILSIASWIKRMAGHEASMLAGLLIVTLPLFGFLSTSAYIDLARAFWELAALYMLYKVWEETHAKTRAFSLVLSGLFAGMALGSKYVSFLVFFPPYLLLAVITLWKNQSVNPVRLIPLWLLAILAPISPWLITNAVWTGNPLYPLFPSVFGMHIPPAQEAYEFIRNHAPQAASLALPALPRYILHRINGLLLDGNALVLIGMIAIATTAWWKNQSAGKSLPVFSVWGPLVYILSSSVLFLLGSENMDGRFFFSTIALLSIPVIFFLYGLSDSIRQTSPWGKYVIPGFALVLLANAVTYRYNQIKDLKESPIPILSETYREQWLNRRFHYYKAAQWANENLPGGASVLGMGYPLRLKHIAKIKYGYIPFLQDFPENPAPKELAERLTGRGFSYIVKPFMDTGRSIDLSILEPDYLESVFSYRGITIYQIQKPGAS